MNNVKILHVTISIIAFITFSCSNSASKNQNSDSNDVSKSTAGELKKGGLYLFKDSDTSYYISKVLVIDDFSVHVRTYNTRFKTKPTKVNSADLDIMIGHAPIDKQGFLADSPELIGVEDVKESELEGYKIYLEEMSK